MKMIRKETAVALAVGLAIAGVATNASAHEKHRHAAKSAVSSHSSSTVTRTVTSSSNVDRRLQQLEDEISALRSELSRARSEAKSDARVAVEKVEAQQQQVEQQLAEAKHADEGGKDLLFFRGGFAKMEHARNDELLLNNTNIGSTTDKKDGEGWYVGAGFDHHLTDDMWGLSDMASVDGEVMFEYKNFGTSHNALVDSAGTTLAALSGLGGTPGLGGGVTVIKNQLTQFTLTASPKIKFNGMGDFRPWIIPVGLAIHVISPPSSGVTVLNPGLMLGAGAEYKIWSSLYAGFDFRYHFTGDDLNYKTKLGNLTVLNKTDIDGFTTGAYLGFGF